MILLAGFLEVLFKALVFIGIAISIGGAIFFLAALRPIASDQAAILRRSALAILAGALTIAVFQAAVLLVDPWALADELGRWPLKAFLNTGFAHFSLLQAGLSLILAVLAFLLFRRPNSTIVLALMVVTSALVMATGAWLTHGASRTANAAPLMAATVLHQLGAITWSGGVIHLVLLRRVMPEGGQDIWPRLLARFSPLAMTAIIVVLAAAAYLSWSYIGGWKALIGTAYGAMVITKGVMLASALILGGMNFFLIRQGRSGDNSGLFSRLPALVEGETMAAVALLLAASSLTSQPPAIDILSERASPSEVAEVFAPKMPRFIPPSRPELLATAASSLDPFAVSGKVDRIQSNFNHNISGMIVLLAGLLALANSYGRSRCTRHWPLVFLLLALFILLFAEPNGWPLGYEGFWETLVSPSVLEHRLATLLLIALALFEWRVRIGKLSGRWEYLFPTLCVAGGALLLTHSHSVTALKWAFLIEVSHLAIGYLAVMMGVSRWIQLRLLPPANVLPARIWPICMMLVGYILIFYREN